MKILVNYQIKQVIRSILGRPVINREYYDFEKAIHLQTISHRKSILNWATEVNEYFGDMERKDLYEASDSPLVIQSYKLTQKVREDFRAKYASFINLRILIHLPPAEISPGGYSLFKNLIDALSYIGINTQALNWNEPISDVLRDFKPTVLLTSDSASYLDQIDWNEVERYRKTNPLKIGLTASIQEYGNTPLLERLDWAGKHNINFFYSFRPKTYLEARQEYKPFFMLGYEIISIEFGANPLIHYTIPTIERDINFSFLGSTNQDKWQRYFSFLKPIFSKHVGFIDGPGWSFAQDFNFIPWRDRYIYARTKAGLNLHVDNQIDWASELNERTYMLAACGVPQLIDNPKLLLSRFSAESLFVAESPKEYEDLFMYILENPDEAERRALNAQREVLASHTTFHRAETLAQALLQQLTS